MKEDESPVLYNHAIIVSNLLMLAKHECLISAFLGKKKILLTSIIDVNLKKKTIILDTSIVDALNTKLLTIPRVKFCTVYNGVQVAFTGQSLVRSKHQGYDVFEMPIPRSLYWFNRRNYYRVSIPDEDFSLCKLHLLLPESAKEEAKINYEIVLNKIKFSLCSQIENDLIEEEKQFLLAYATLSEKDAIQAKLERQKIERERELNPILPDENLLDVITLRLFDISLSGGAMFNDDEDFSYFLTIGTTYENCVIVMPDYGQITVSLEIVAKRDLDENSSKCNELVCFKFIDAEQAAESMIFRYIQALDRLKKKYSVENLLTLD